MQPAVFCAYFCFCFVAVSFNKRRTNGLPGSAFGTSRTGARFLLRDLVHNKVFFTRSTSDYVIFSSANFVFNMDFNELYRAHVESGADITVLTASAPRAVRRRREQRVETAAASGMANCPMSEAMPMLMLIPARLQPWAAHRGSIKAFMQ